MKNAEIIKNVTDYIQEVAKERGLTHRDIADLCSKNGDPVAQTTITKMFKKPSSTTISTLLKVCDGLGLNLNNTFHTMENMKTAGKNNENLFHYNITEYAFARYPGDYHMFFLSTTPHAEEKLVRGTLHLGDVYSTGECTATLQINTGDLDEENGKEAVKHFEGRLIYSTTGVMFCNLVCTKYGDMWFLTFPHTKLNIQSLSCTMGCAATSCSGPNAYPAIHRFCFCNAKEYPKISKETEREICGILRMHNQTMFIKKDTLQDYLNERKNEKNRLVEHIDHYLEIADIYYAIPKDTFKNDTDIDSFSHTMTELASLSSMETCMHILPSDNTQLYQILDRDRKKTAKKE